MSEQEHMSDEGSGFSEKVEQEIDVEQAINTDALQNIPVSISVEVGRTMIRIQDLLKLKQGSVLELERIAGEPLDLFVNNTVVAQGEVVLVNERYGVRLTHIIPSEDRMKKL